MKQSYVDISSRSIINISLTDEFNVYEVNRVSVPKGNLAQGKIMNNRGKGIARRLMKALLAEADKENVTLILWIYPSGGLTYEQLEAWYTRCGFVRQEIGNYLREPKL